jgi:alcohol dehydrogenase
MTLTAVTTTTMAGIKLSSASSGTGRMMKAAVYREFGGPIRVEEVPIPSVPADGILLQVMATGVCRSDWHGWKGHDSDVVEHGLPFVPGHELSGVVVEVGNKTKKFQVGDRVAVPFILSCGSCRYCGDVYQRPTVCQNQQQPGFTQWGSFAEYVALPRADRNMCHIPREVTFVQAAALGCRLTTAYRAIVQQGRLNTKNKRNETVAIFGCGGLGLSCILIAKAVGATRILAIDISLKALQKARELGATHTVLATRPSTTTAGTDENKNGDTVREQVLKLTPFGDGADLTVDAAGFSATVEDAIACTRPAGRMVQVGLPIGDETTQQPKIPMALVAGRELKLIGSHGFASQELPKLLQWVATKKLDPSILVEQCVTLQEGAHAIEQMDHSSPLGMVMVTNFSSPSRL